VNAVTQTEWASVWTSMQISQLELILNYSQNIHAIKLTTVW